MVNIRIPDYPEDLLKRGYAYSGSKTPKECIDLLGRHYGIHSPLDHFMDPSLSNEQQANRWLDLALCLARDLVPAFRLSKRKTAETDPDAFNDWLQAGGSPFSFIKLKKADVTAFYQAQLVEAITAKEQATGKVARLGVPMGC
jgi:hypothetical protein